MVPTAVHFKSFGILFYLFSFNTLNKNKLHRQLVGSLRMLELIALLNLLRAVFPCKSLLRFTIHLRLYLFLKRICWPFDVEQPAGAAHLTENLNVAFELVQVRTGETGLKPMHRNGITPEGTREAVGIEIRQTIDLCRGEKGQELRRNAEQFKVKFAEAWEENGTARKEVRRFLHKYT